MTTILLIRHGETDWNKEEIFRGRADIKLNENGVKQAGLLAKYLAGEEIEAVYSSPLNRALSTAEIVSASHNVAVKLTHGLIDFDYGEWQGLSHQQVEKKFPALYEQWASSPQLVTMPHGENLDDVKTRAIRLIDEVIASRDGIVALVSHRVVHKVLICALLGLDNSHFWNIKLDTCGITIFVHKNDRFVLARHNDTSFLKPLAEAVPSDF